MLTIPSAALSAPNARSSYSHQSNQIQVPSSHQYSLHNAPAHDVYVPTFAGPRGKKDTIRKANAIATETAKEAARKLRELQGQDLSEAEIDKQLTEHLDNYIKDNVSYKNAKHRGITIKNLIDTAKAELKKGEQNMRQVGESAVSQVSFNQQQALKAKMAKSKAALLAGDEPPLTEADIDDI